VKIWGQNICHATPLMCVLGSQNFMDLRTKQIYCTWNAAECGHRL